jgi:hypothetical protein
MCFHQADIRRLGTLMNPESGATPGASRLLYPHLPDLPTTAELHGLFSPSYDERAWASTVARRTAGRPSNDDHDR